MNPAPPETNARNDESGFVSEPRTLEVPFARAVTERLVYQHHLKMGPPTVSLD